MTYYNTTSETGAGLANYKHKADSQDQQILDFFRSHQTTYFTAETIHRMVLPNAPLTSVRRGISNLHKDGLLAKHTKVKGQYGRPIYLWKLVIT